jgi:hypothetical protein
MSQQSFHYPRSISTYHEGAQHSIGILYLHLNLLDFLSFKFALSKSITTGSSSAAPTARSRMIVTMFALPASTLNLFPSKQIRFSSRYLEIDLGDARREEVKPKALLPPLREDIRLLALVRRGKGGSSGLDTWEKGRTYLTCCVRLSEEKNTVSLSLTESVGLSVCLHRLYSALGRIGVWLRRLVALLRQMAKGWVDELFG